MKKNPVKTVVVVLALLLGMATGLTATAQTLMPQLSVLKGERNFMTGYDPVNLDGTVNVVIEIPAGTIAKYMVDIKSGMIELEQKNGLPRYVQYLGYPCNYGNIPRSILLKSKGGDGDAVDALVLGPSVPTGSVVRGRAIGMLSLIDTGEKDDKVVVVMENSPFASVRSIEELDRRFPGVTTILQTWFTSYKGRDKDGKLMLSSTGFKGRAETIRFIGDAVLDYENSVVTDADRRPLDEKGNPYLYRWPGAKNVGE
ncbi:MAG TPA: inorganic diphosphatase [Thermoanaerobaculia bacterium]|nr:inorganic diphosphatase [Thermoanaerobaculia bacterium]HQR66238.1 inorganic diphosphatase [Thermoanaerobaculia bacterium]